MKIFVMLSRVPYPLEKGDKLRAYHQIKLLAQNHEVYLCCLSDKKVPEANLQHLRTIVTHLEVIYLNRILIVWRMLIGLFSDKPFQVHYFLQWHALRNVRKRVESFAPDHIYCQLIRCSEYVKNLHAIPKTLDYMDALSAGHLRRVNTSPWYTKSLLRIESKRLLAYENLVFDYFDHHTIISQQDQQLIFHRDRKKIVVIPNGVDIDFFHPMDEKKKFDIVLTGNMSYPPNVDSALFLAKEILPLVLHQHPSARLLIAGASPTKSLLDLQNEKIVVSGWMNDIREAYAQSRIFAAPLRIGSGLQNKLLEAMSMELPCVTSSLAANAIGPDADRFLEVTEGAQPMADAIIKLLADPEFAKSQGLRGRMLVSERFNWSKSVEKLEEIFIGKIQS